MAAPLPKHILLRASGENSPLHTYYDEMARRTQALQQNLAPYDETIDRARSSMNNIDEELNALYERIYSLEQQKDELEGVEVDAHQTRAKIMEAHGTSLVEYNTSFFKKAAKEYKVPELADTSKSWDVDLAYFPTFGIMFILEMQEETYESINPDDDDPGGMTDWMNNVNQ